MREVPKYRRFGDVFVQLRRQGGWTQLEFATRLNLTQQTVSRWEQGLSRPRSKDIPVIAGLLTMDAAELYRAAGYAAVDGEPARPLGAATYDRPLPLYALSAESFENFCVEFLARHYRERCVTVNRYGGTGHKQHGIDIEVKGDFGVYTFQCKRVEEFGEQKVHTAIAAQTYVADLKGLLLSNVASPKARDAISLHPGWELWDREDISRRFNSLPVVDRKDLVDIFFRGQREALLGIPEAGPLMSPQDFFRPLLQHGRFFTHSWSLVGREAELAELKEYVLNEEVPVTLLVGAPGNGKTRILREVVDRVNEEEPRLLVRFISPTEDVKAQHLDELGQGPKLLVVDDAHDREDVGQLLRYAAVPENKARLLLALRPYGKEMLYFQAAAMSMNSSEIATVELRTPTKEDAYALAAQVLAGCAGPITAAKDIAEATYTTPLVTVLAAQVVAKEGIHPALLLNVKDFQNHVLARLEDILAGRIVTGQDVPKLQSVLRILALVQPVIPDNPGLLALLREVEDVQQDDAKRLMRLLTEAGVLFKRGLRYRIAPDLLADSIIQRNFINPDGSATEKVEAVFNRSDTDYLKQLLVNLGRLDWRLRSGSTEDSKLLESLASKLRWLDTYHNPHIEAVEAVAYYQPRLALDFASRLIKEGHGSSPSVCGMIRNAAFNMGYLEEACPLLWRAGRTDGRALHQHPEHGIRILKEMAEFAPDKPIEYVHRVVRFALDLLNRPNSLNGTYTPFTILEGALRTEMEETTSTARSFTIKRYHLDLATAKGVREEVIAAILEALENGPARKAFLAAVTLAEALRGPMHEPDESDAWKNAHCEVLRRTRVALDNPTVHPVVLVEAAKSVSWHAFFGAEPCKSQAQSIIDLLDRDIETRLVRALVDGWGSETWPLSESLEREAHEVHSQELVVALTKRWKQPEALYDLLNHWLHEIEQIAHKGYGAPHMLINRLLSDASGLAEEVLVRQSEPSPLCFFAGTALSVLLAKEEKSKAFSEVMLRSKDSMEALRLVAEAYSRQSKRVYTDADMPVLRMVFASRDAIVLRHAGGIARQVARLNPSLAVELICSADFSVDERATHEFFEWLSHETTIPSEVIRPEQWRKLLEGLTHPRRLDDHWVRRFLKKAMAVVPDDVVGLVKERLTLSAGKGEWRYAAPSVARNGEGLGLMAHPDGKRLLRGLLDWAVENGTGTKWAHNIGQAISGLSGKYDKALVDLLLEWMSGGGQFHAKVVANVLRSAQHDLVYEFPQFVRDVLNAAELIGEEAVGNITSGLISATISGSRSTSPGEPFPEDLKLEKHAKDVLSGLSRVDPAYELFSSLLRHARDGIAQQGREKEAMEEDDG